LTVPLDYAHPTGPTLQIAVTRLRTGGHRIGSLVINPGGPGGSGIDYAQAARNVIPSSVRDRFDIVGFDPRGVGESSPVRCVSGSVLDQLNELDPLVSARAQSQLIAVSKQLANGCKAKAGNLLSHIATIDAARDMDVLRAALGETKLTYMGKSYGTFLGTLYANLFPQRVRAMILDGAVDPQVSAEEIARIQGQGFETAFAAFLHNCVQVGCSLGSTYSDAMHNVNVLLTNAAAHPLPASRYRGADNRLVNRAELELGIIYAMYDRANWPTLRQAISEAQDGDGSRILFLADQLWERDLSGDYTNLEESYYAISCIDRPWPTALSTYEHDADVWGVQSPHFGWSEAWDSLPCAYWPVPAVSKAGPLHARGAPPILVIGTTRDPATPYINAQRLASELDSGVLLTYDGDGHTVWGEGTSSCVDHIGNAYLINLTVPSKGTRC
jgi:pimeloyl-ACP methyl ester carboxylesterase